MKVLKKKEQKFYKIKVNKKDSNNQFNISQNDFNLRYKLKFASNIDSPNNSNISPYYQKNSNIPYLIIKNYKSNSNSEEKVNKSINNHQYNKKAYNYIVPKRNFKNSIINQENLKQNYLMNFSICFFIIMMNIFINIIFTFIHFFFRIRI